MLLDIFGRLLTRPPGGGRVKGLGGGVFSPANSKNSCIKHGIGLSSAEDWAGRGQ